MCICLNILLSDVCMLPLAVSLVSLSSFCFLEQSAMEYFFQYLCINKKSWIPSTLTRGKLYSQAGPDLSSKLELNWNVRLYPCSLDSPSKIFTVEFNQMTVLKHAEIASVQSEMFITGLRKRNWKPHWHWYLMITKIQLNNPLTNKWFTNTKCYRNSEPQVAGQTVALISNTLSLLHRCSVNGLIEQSGLENCFLVT